MPIDPNKIVWDGGESQVNETNVAWDEGEPKWGEVAVQALKNIPSSGAEFVTNVITPFIHPVQTAESLGSAVLGAVEKIPGGKYLTPGPAYAQVGEGDKRAEAIDAVVGYFGERYGSMEGFKKAVANDPVGVTADIASVLTTSGVGVAAKFPKTGKTISKSGLLLEPANVIRTPIRAAKRLIPEALPSKLYESAIKFSGKLTRRERASLTKTALENRVLPNYKGMDNLREKITSLNDEITLLIDQVATTDQRIPVKRLFREFRQLKQSALLTGEPVKAQRAINNIRKEIYIANNRIGRKDFTPQQVQKLKQNIYKDLSSYYSEVAKSPASKKAQKAVAKAAKESLEELIPEIKQLNRREGDLLALHKEIEKAATRIGNRDILSMGTTVRAAGGGAVAGGPGLAVGLALGLMDSQPLLKARLAILVEKMRTRGIKVRVTPTVSRLLSYEVGKITEEVEGE
jgi:hypothetical protein